MKKKQYHRILTDIYAILEIPSSSKKAKYINYFLFFVIAVSIFSFFISTVKQYHIYNDIFNLIELIAFSVFSVEFVVRFVVSGVNKKYSGIKGKLKYLKNPFTIIDMLVLVSFYISVFDIDLLFLRVFMVFRILKLLRYESKNHFDILLWQIIKQNREKFYAVFGLSIGIVLIASPVMYYLERASQPEVFSSIPQTIWWSIVTFTTVGYGDMYPISSLGKVLASFLSVLGITFYTIPGAIFIAALLDKLKDTKLKGKR